MTTLHLKGLATGVGSLPFREPQEAFELISRYLPEIPFWPQLPKRDKREGMIAQYSEHLPCLRFLSGELVYDGTKRENELQEFYEKIIAQDLDYFRISPEYAAGLHYFYNRLSQGALKRRQFIKCHITGPFTFSSAISDEKSVSLLFDKIFLQAVSKGLAMKAKWQIKFFSQLCEHIIVFVDEPYLGSFGSAYTPLNREEVVAQLAELTQELCADNVSVGVHCCGNTDWSMFTEIPSIKIINFDAYEYLDRVILFADKLKAFLEGGGILCWGIVPTSESGQDKISEEFLIEKLEAGINTLIAKGVSEDAVRNNLLLSPACGFGSSSPQQAENAFNLLSRLARRVQEL